MDDLTPVSRYLKEHHIPHRLFRHSNIIRSIEQAALERGQVPAQVVRSILFRLDKESYVMVLIAGQDQLSWHKLRHYLGISRMTMASKEEVLAVTGYSIGTVAPFGLQKSVRILLDDSVFSQTEISFGAGEPAAGIIMRREDFVHALGEIESGSFRS